MSRTTRKKNPKGTFHKSLGGTLRDGAHQHYSSGCKNHGSCDYCKGNRTFKNKRREPTHGNDF